MSNQTNKLFECCVANPTRIEAIEIVERLVANGAEAYDVVNGMVVGVRVNKYTHDEYECWGCTSDNRTYTGSLSFNWAKSAKQLTMQEFRAAFPCEKYDGVNSGLQVGEIMELIEDTDFFSAQTGEATTLKAGHKVVIVGIATRYDNNATCAVVQSKTNTSCGFCVLNPDFLRPIKSDRDKFIESAVKAFNSGCMADYSGQPFIDGIAAPYDAGFKAPESK